MSFDDNLRDRFAAQSPAVDGLHEGAAQAAQSAGRRTAVVRSGGALMLMAVVGLGAFFVTNRTGDTELETASPEPDTTEPDTTAAADEQASDPGTDVAPIDISQTVGIVTVDVDGVVRVNGEPLDIDPLVRDGFDPEDITIAAVDGAGTLYAQTNAGVFTLGTTFSPATSSELMQQSPGVTLHDVSAEYGPLMSWTEPVGPVISWSVDGGQSLEATPVAASYGPDGAVLLTMPLDDCNLPQVLNPQGDSDTTSVLLQRSACFPGEIAEWSSVGIIVLARPTEEDAWHLSAMTETGSFAQVTIPGAFQPKAVDVHTNAEGQTEAVILGTGEELVYIDVDRFLTNVDPATALVGISNEVNVVSARLVIGLPPHPYRPVDEASIAPTDDTEPESVAGDASTPDGSAPATIDDSDDVPDSSLNDSTEVFRIANVADDDTLNARAGAGTEFDVLFEFAHNATGVVRTSSDPVAVGGSEWVEVFAPISGTEFDGAWVNSAFLEPIEAPYAAPCLFNGPQDHYIGIDWTNTDGDPNADSAVVSGIDTYRFGACIRTVIEFSTGWSYEDGPIEYSTALATDIVVRRSAEGGLLAAPGPVIDFGSTVIGAEVAEERFAESEGVSHSTFVYMGTDRTIDGLLYGPTSDIDVRYDNVNGRIIIDTRVVDSLPESANAEVQDRLGGSSPLIDDKGLVITKVTASADQQEWTFAGLGRPFEATLGATVQANGLPLVVGWTNGVIAEPSAVNGIMTSTWTEAWGSFEFSIVLPAGVDPADVVVIIDPVGALDVPDTVDIALADHAG